MGQYRQITISFMELTIHRELVGIKLSREISYLAKDYAITFSIECLHFDLYLLTIIYFGRMCEVIGYTETVVGGGLESGGPIKISGVMC